MFYEFKNFNTVRQVFIFWVDAYLALRCLVNYCSLYNLSVLLQEEALERLVGIIFTERLVY